MEINNSNLKSPIAWTHFTVNFWMGCQKVSQGCKFCYMHRIIDGNGENPNKVWRTSSSNWNKAKSITQSKLIFTCSMSDFFIQEADEWRDEAWKIIKSTPQHQWQILTKRPERIKDCLPDDWGEEGYSNVWLGVSVADESEIHRVDTLNAIKTAGSKFLTFISAEPLIGPVDFIKNTTSFEKSDWLIVGGESGNKFGKWQYRPCELPWIKSIIGQCWSYNIPIFVKQVGTHLADKFKLKDNKGEDWNEWDPTFKVREYPTRFRGVTY